MSTRLLILKGSPAAAVANEADEGLVPSYKLLQLPNPSTGQQQQYVLTAEGLLELNRVKYAATSWLVEDAFMSDGSCYMATPINMVYVLLAVLQSDPHQAEAMFQEAESLLCSEQWPAAQQLVGLAAQHLPCICDVKALEGCTYYKLNNSKVLACLRVCVNQTLAAFRAHSVSSIAGLTEQEQQAYMLRFLKEYISAAWHDMLLSSYGLDPCTFNAASDGSTPATRPAGPTPTPESEKKQKVVDPKEAARKKAEASRAAAAAAKMAKQAAGSKKISLFFTAKKPS